MGAAAKQETHNCTVIGCDFAQGGEPHSKQRRCWLEDQPGLKREQRRRIEQLCGKSTIKTERQKDE